MADLKQQMEWRGNRLVWTGMMKCAHHLDRPQQQDRVVVLKADPAPLRNARPDIDGAFVKSALTYADGSAIAGVRASDWITSLLNEVTPVTNTFTLGSSFLGGDDVI